RGVSASTRLLTASRWRRRGFTTALPGVHCTDGSANPTQSSPVWTRVRVETRLTCGDLAPEHLPGRNRIGAPQVSPNGYGFPCPVKSMASDQGKHAGSGLAGRVTLEATEGVPDIWLSRSARRLSTLITGLR